MAVDLVMEIQGYDGESKRKGHENQIDVLSWSWGMVQPSTIEFGGGGGAGKCSFQELSIICNVDKSTPKLMQACATGDHIDKATLFVKKAGGSSFDYVKYEMEELMVTSIQVSGSSERPTVSISFAATRVFFKYFPQKPDGTADAEVPFGWDIEKNEDKS